MTVVEHARDTTHPIPRPAYAQPKLIAFVFLGGALGASARLGLTLAMPSDAGDDWPVLIANLVGAFLLGLLLTGLASRKPETPGRRDFRLFAGTGFMGGFTTYSSLATNTAELFESDVLGAVLYSLGTLLGGIAAAAVGIWLAGLVWRPRDGKAAS
ncbi:fluoride efflux transporter FluC [Microbacterium lushaniae]|uniref:Fluoride-specific ion channel FluC n=1 Tax=Microbacterium lushaniae TaxID=2614639 RepID=A0A5J6L6V2_9MICO|nr:CrcB family protein [Microbacterium lushaniae]QEW04141.1 CrcB family protein [Microbacterium lushaniae]